MRERGMDAAIVNQFGNLVGNDYLTTLFHNSHAAHIAAKRAGEFIQEKQTNLVSGILYGLHVVARRLSEQVKFGDWGTFPELLHDLNNTMMSLCYNAEQARDRWAKNMIDETWLGVQSARRAATVSRDMVLDAGGDSVRILRDRFMSTECVKPRKIDDVINTAFNLCDARQIGGRNVQCFTPISVRKQESEFIRMMMILIDNAYKAMNAKMYTEGQKPFLQVYSDLIVDKTYVSISVKDNGIGMTDDVVARACERKFTMFREQGGTGFGLYNCKEIVEKKFHGDLQITSTVGEGSVFTVNVLLEDLC